MPKSVFIGEFEQLVLLTLLPLGSEAYPVQVQSELIRVTGRDTSRGALYRTLDRLEGKQYV